MLPEKKLNYYIHQSEFKLLFDRLIDTNKLIIRQFIIKFMITCETVFFFWNMRIGVNKVLFLERTSV
jgi:hypothetical protein